MVPMATSTPFRIWIVSLYVFTDVVKVLSILLVSSKDCGLVTLIIAIIFLFFLPLFFITFCSDCSYYSWLVAVFSVCPRSHPQGAAKMKRLQRKT